MGRPPTKPKRFKDGFYIEVRNKGANMGMKIHFDSEIEMKEAAQMYGSSKEVVILGEHKKDKWLSLEGGEEKKERKAKAPKPEKPAKAEKVEKPVKAEKPAKAAKAEKPAKAAKAVKPAKPAKKEKPVKAPAKKKK